jgi:uncharacterized membrane protein
VNDRVLRAAVATLALAGASIAGYLTYSKLTDSRIACAIGGCETVQDSRYAELLGIPVATVGLVAYLLIGASALSSREAVRLAAASIAVAGVVFSGYLVVVQAAVIDAFCLWCLASDAVITLLAAATLLRLSRLDRVLPDRAGTADTRRA